MLNFLNLITVLWFYKKRVLFLGKIFWNIMDKISMYDIYYIYDLLSNGSEKKYSLSLSFSHKYGIMLKIWIMSESFCVSLSLKTFENIKLTKFMWLRIISKAFKHLHWMICELDCPLVKTQGCTTFSNGLWVLIFLITFFGNNLSLK